MLTPSLSFSGKDFFHTQHALPRTLRRREGEKERERRQTGCLSRLDLLLPSAAGGGGDRDKDVFSTQKEKIWREIHRQNRKSFDIGIICKPTKEKF